MSKKLSVIVHLCLLGGLLLAGCIPAEQQTAAPTAPPTETIPTVPAATPTPAPTPTSAPPQPLPVEPVMGLPQGSQGYPWWNDSVFYEIFVRSFYDSDGDGTGDFNGIIEKLDYLNDGDPETTTDLGVTALWLMPIFPSPSYHGYDVTDYYDVNPEYGTMDDFKRLLEEAHRRGIRVTIDMVINHTSTQHPWFRESRDAGSEKRDWYLWTDTDPGYLGPWGQKVWHPTGMGDYYYGLFWDGMPDLNFRNPDVTAQVQDIARFWLEEVQVDGFRLDGARHLIEEGREQADTPATQEWFQGYQAFIRSVSPEAVTIGELWTSSFIVAGFVKEDAVDLAFSFDLANAFVRSANSGRADSATGQLATDVRIFPPGQFATFLTNHDMDRVMSQLSANPEKAKNAASLLLTAPGVPFIYYGEEIGMTGTKPDELIRRPMQWSGEKGAGFTGGSPWQSPALNFRQNNVALQTDDPGSLLAHYRTLVQLRNRHVALRVGETLRLKADSPALYALLRFAEGEAVLVVINLGDQPVEDYSLELASGPLAGAYQAVSLLDGEVLPILEANARGGFDTYQPLPALTANSTWIIQLQAAP